MDSNQSMVRLQVSALANVSNSPTMVVLILTPIAGHDHSAEHIRRAFPVTLHRLEGVMHFKQIVMSLHGEERFPRVEEMFLKHHSIAIEELTIQRSEAYPNGFSAKIKARHQDRNIIEIEEQLSTGVLMAHFAHAPIYISERLLDEVSRSLKMNFVDEHGDKISSENGMRILQKAIIKDSNPEEMSDNTKLILGSLAPKEIEELKAFAVDNELYEWAGFLSDLEMVQQDHTQPGATRTEETPNIEE